MPTAADLPTLSVVVPATNRPPTLDRCRAAIEASTDPPDEVVVVDGPASLSAVEARNVGAERARGDVVVFVDADVEVHADALGRVRAAFTADPGLTAVHGSYDDRPRARGIVSVFRNLLHHHVHQAGAGPAVTFWTGLGAIRRTDLLAVGGFDAVRYRHPSIEDIELGQRLAAGGRRLRLDPAIQGTHLKRWTLRSMLFTDFVRRGVPWVALQLRTRQVATTLNCGWRHRVSAAACAIGPLAVLLGLPLVGLAALASLLGLNRAFYGLLVRELGVLQAGVCVALHGLHHLVAVTAVPVGIVVGLLAAAGPLRSPRSNRLATATAAATATPTPAAARLGPGGTP
jgi:GT2 family glycosyltransferase